MENLIQFLITQLFSQFRASLVLQLIYSLHFEQPIVQIQYDIVPQVRVFELTV